MEKHKLPRVVRLDDSDLQVYDQAAEPGEFAVPGGFEYLQESIETLSGKRMQAFKNGFLGIQTSGRSTLVAIYSLRADEYQNAINQLTVSLMSNFNVPNRQQAFHVATEEIRYAESLCEYDDGTILALEREFSDEEVKERFKKFVPANTANWEDSKPLIYSLEEN